MSSLPVVVINVTITITKTAALNYTAHMHTITMGPGPFLGDTVHHNFSSLGFFLHQDALHSCISKGRGNFPDELLHYLLPNNPVLCSKASDDLALNVSPNLRQKIIAGEYVDLANLLINSQATQSEGDQLRRP
jgi:hypothetical protein